MNNFKYAIICVDDDFLILQTLKFQLSKCIDDRCVLIESFLSPEDALLTIEDLVEVGLNMIFVIVDFQMPEMNGAKFIRAVKDSHPEIPCLMLSGEANAIQIEELESDNLLFSFIGKPWSETHLINAMQPWLSKVKC
jgi:CheY-like chemotaxis protein